MSEYSINTISTFAPFLVIWYKSRKSFIPRIPFIHTENIIFRMKYVPNNILIVDSLFLSIHINFNNIYNFAPNHFPLSIMFRSQLFLDPSFPTATTITASSEINNNNKTIYNRRILSSFLIVP